MLPRCLPAPREDADPPRQRRTRQTVVSKPDILAARGERRGLYGARRRLQPLPSGARRRQQPLPSRVCEPAGSWRSSRSSTHLRGLLFLANSLPGRLHLWVFGAEDAREGSPSDVCPPGSSGACGQREEHRRLTMNPRLPRDRPPTALLSGRPVLMEVSIDASPPSLTAHCPLLTAHNPQPTARSLSSQPQLTASTHSSQLTAHCSLLTAAQPSQRSVLNRSRIVDRSRSRAERSNGRVEKALC